MLFLSRGGEGGLGAFNVSQLCEVHVSGETIGYTLHKRRHVEFSDVVLPE